MYPPVHDRMRMHAYACRHALDQGGPARWFVTSAAHSCILFVSTISKKWGTCALRHRGRRGRESQCKACLGACLGGIAFCGQFLCFAFQSFRHRSQAAVFLDKVLHKSEVLVLVLVHVSCHSPFALCNGLRS